MKVQPLGTLTLDWDRAQPLSGDAVAVPHRQPCRCGYCGSGLVTRVVVGETEAVKRMKRWEPPR